MDIVSTGKQRQQTLLNTVISQVEVGTFKDIPLKNSVTATIESMAQAAGTGKDFYEQENLEALFDLLPRGTRRRKPEYTSGARFLRRTSPMLRSDCCV